MDVKPPPDLPQKGGHQSTRPAYLNIKKIVCNI